MDKETLLKRISDIEWDDFEVKKASGELPKNIWETVSAFANTSGGWIVLGITQQGKNFEITGNAMLRDQLFGVMSARPVERSTHEDLNRTTLRRYRDYMTRFNPGLMYNALPKD
jgi:hypothetical protein